MVVEVWEEVDLVVVQVAAQAVVEWEAAGWEVVAMAEEVKEVGLVVARVVATVVEMAVATAAVAKVEEAMEEATGEATVES